MWAGMMAHNNSCGVGRTQDWASHDIEHELSAQYDCAHGAGLAVVMPAVFTYNLKHNVMRFAQAAVRVWGLPDELRKSGGNGKRGHRVSAPVPEIHRNAR